MSELKPCPFCGSSNTTLDYYEISCPQELGTIVVCNDCGASATSIVDWNTRPIEDALNARIAELEAENDRLQDAWFLDETICPDGSLRPTVSQLLSRIAELEAAQKEALSLLPELEQGHYYCDDCWYSCPKAVDGCCDESQGDECNCVADKYNQLLSEIISLLTPPEVENGKQ